MSQAAVPRLIAITDLGVLGRSELVARLGRLVRAATAGSVAVLLRDHAASARQRLALGEELRAATREAQQQLWVADRLDLAQLLEADGVHLGEGSVPARQARRLLGARIRLSRAWHRPEVDAELDGELDGVDALLLSPIFEARKGRPALGLPALTQLAGALQSRSSRPALYALGGATAEHVAACQAAGATGIAAIGSALAADPAALLEALGIRAVGSVARGPNPA